MEHDSRITDLEIQLAHQTRMLEDMSDELHRQGQEIDRLKTQIRALIARQAEPDMGAPAAHQPPPHW